MLSDDSEVNISVSRPLRCMLDYRFRGDDHANLASTLVPHVSDLALHV